MKIGHLLLLPWFLLRLSLHVSPTLLKFAAIPVAKHKAFALLLICLAISLSLGLLVGKTSVYTLIHARLKPQPTPVSQELIIDEIAYWEQILALQPTHRDVLINLAILYQAKGDHQRAEEYLKKARQLDPNNPYFLQSN